MRQICRVMHGKMQTQQRYIRKSVKMNVRICVRTNVKVIVKIKYNKTYVEFHNNISVGLHVRNRQSITAVHSISLHSQKHGQWPGVQLRFMGKNNGPNFHKLGSGAPVTGTALRSMD